MGDHLNSWQKAAEEYAKNSAAMTEMFGNFCGYVEYRTSVLPDAPDIIIEGEFPLVTAEQNFQRQLAVFIATSRRYCNLVRKEAARRGLKIPDDE